MLISHDIGQALHLLQRKYYSDSFCYSIARVLYKDKLEISETPTRTGMSVSTAVSTAGQTMTEPEKYSDLGEISAVTGVSESDSCSQTSQCAFSVIRSAKHKN